MVPNDNHPGSPGDSLKKTLKQRQLEAEQRAFEDRRRAASGRTNLSPTVPVADPKTTKSVPIPPSTPGIQSKQGGTQARTTTTTAAAIPNAATQKGRIIGLSGVLVLVVIGVGVLLTSVNRAVSPVGQPSVHLASSEVALGANQVITQFKKGGLPISGQRNIPISNNAWKASQEILFDVQQSGESGSFIMLSYPDSETLDVGKVISDPRFKGWQALTASNVILLIAPQTSSKLRVQIGNYLTQSLTAPVQRGTMNKE